MDDDYREHLTAVEQKAQESYEKTVLSLSGGALAVAFAFVTNFVEHGSMQAAGWLVAAWISRAAACRQARRTWAWAFRTSAGTRNSR
jgi:hypothetical protein